MRITCIRILIISAAMGSLPLEAGRPGPAPCNCGPRPGVPSAPLPVPHAPVFAPPAGMMVPSAAPCAPCGAMLPQGAMSLRPEMMTVMQPVTRTEIHQEAYTVDVPVTTYRQVTVDEGGYQQVWVPKLVTKSVPETVVQKEVRYRTVERQVTQNFPQTITRLVPQQMQAMTPPPPTASPAGPVATPTGSSARPATTPAEGIIVPSPYSPPPAGQNSTADAQASTSDHASQWRKVPQKVTESAPSSSVELQSFERQEPSAPRRLFSPVPPTAATVWQAQHAFR